MAGNQQIPTENIDEVILRLLKLEPGMEIDYQTYYEIIKKKLAVHRIAGKELPQEEQVLLEEELKRVWRIKDRQKKRIKVKEKKTKVSGGTPPPKGGMGAPPKTSAIIKIKTGKLSTHKFLDRTVKEVNVKDVTEKKPETSKKDDPLDRIIKRLDSIIKTLIDLNRENKEESERQRKNSENKKRKEKEESLESKIFNGIKTAVKKMIAPFQSIWDYIINFLWNVFLGKIVLKLLDWFSDKKNKDKIGSIIRFFKDWWPTMLGAYILFGTAFGKLARGVVGIAFRGAVGFGKIIARLIAAIAKGKGLKGIAGALAGEGKALGGGIKGGGWKGALLKGGLAIGGSLLAGFAIDKGVEALTGGGDKQKPVDNKDNQEQSKLNVPNDPKIPMLNAATGGLADIGKIFGKFGNMEGMLGPLGLLMSLMNMKELPQEFQGLVSGKKGTDKIPAMLTDGEFVMSKGAVQKYGVDALESMNAAGGGTNVPKIVKGIPHAVGGGLIGGEGVSRQPSGLINWYGRQINPYDSNQMSLDDFFKWVDSRITERMYGGPGMYSSKYFEGSPKTSLSGYIPKPTIGGKFSSVPESRMLPAAGESSANAMRAAAKTTRVIREPIPTSRAIVPYEGGGLVKSGVTGGLSESIPQIKTNMRVPGGFGSLKEGVIGILANIVLDKISEKINKSILGGQIERSKSLRGRKKEDYVNSLRNRISEEQKWQKGPGGLFDKIVRFGGETSSEQMSKRSTDILSGMGLKPYQGGAIVGGYKLKNQSFKDAPKTMVMTDEKGRPFVGHKAMKNGKLTYVRPPSPGTGTSNIFEMFGRMINPGAYRESDARIAMKNQKIAMVNALESFQSQGMATDAQARMMKQMGGNLKDVQNDLNYRRKEQKGDAKIYRGGQRSNSRLKPLTPSTTQRRRSAVRPPVKPAPRYNPAGGGINGIRGKNRGGSGNTSMGSVRPVAATRGRGSTASQKRHLGINK